MGHDKTKREVVDILLRKRRKRKDLYGGAGPKLSLCTSDPLSYCQSNAVDKESLDYHFSLLKQTLEDNNLMNKAGYI